MTPINSNQTFESQVHQSQRLETLGTLAGGIAHDFNNQLTVILNNLALALQDENSDDSVRSCLADAQHAAQRCVDMTRGLLAFSRRVKPVLKPTPLNRLFEETERLLRRVMPASIAIQFFAEPDLFPVLAEATQVQQVLVNLAVNARDAMADGGVLRVEARNAGPFVEITVADNGAGMDSEILGRAFEPFFTTKTNRGGTGLGLATVERIVKTHGGSIEVYSQPGEGTTFRIGLPRAAGVEECPALGASDVPRLCATVLVVEDDELVRRAAATILRLSGCRVIEAGNGCEAVQVFTSQSAGIDLVFTDLDMPKCGGLMLIEQLRQMQPGVKTLLATGYADHTHAGECLAKPYSARDLLGRVEELLARRS